MKLLKVFFGILSIFSQFAIVLLFQDPVVCRFDESDQCYVAPGQQLHLQIPLEDGFNLIRMDKTSTKPTILKYRKSQTSPPKPNHPRWQFVTENNTLILNSAESSDSGTYNLDTFDAGGTSTGIFTLQLHIEGSGFRVFVSVWVFEMIILLSLFVGAHIYTRIYMKQRTTENQEAL